MLQEKVNIELFPHNQRAYDAVLRLLEKEGKAAVIHPTGTGKSFIGFKLVWENPQAHILWLAPSEYIFQTQLENLRESLSGSSQEKDIILKQITSKLKFMTYYKLMLDGEASTENSPEYIILDEFHRCGAAEWGKGVDRLLSACPKAKLLGLSATNVRYLDNRRDMAEEIFDGCVASKMTLGEAVAKKILLAPTYVISMYSYQKEIERLRKRVKSGRDQFIKKQNEELLEQLRRSLENADGLDKVFDKYIGHKRGKYVVFCAGREHMEEMILHVDEWFRFVDKHPHIYKVVYGDSGSSKQFADFKEDNSGHLKLLFCIDMLNEGVHVGGVDGVILLRPTVSPVLYLQQIGRALTVDKARQKQPIIFDVVNNFESLYSVDALQREFDEAYALISCTESEREKYRDSFRVIDELRDCRKLFDAINRNLTAAWEVYYQEAKAFYEREGHLDVKKRYITESGLNLGSWLMTQRRVYAGTVAGKLSERQVQQLSAIGMRWKSRKEEQFDKGIAELKAYVAAYGHADTGSRYESPDGFPLGTWLSNMRTRYHNGTLEEAALERLEKAGMIWDINRYRWEAYYQAAKRYRKEFGNLDIPYDYVTEDGKKLGVWIKNQKNNYPGKKEGTATLTEAQVQKLEQLGIQWTGRFDREWNRKYRLAEKYYREHGSLEMPSTYVYQGAALGKWLNNIRLSRKKAGSNGYVLTEKRIRELDEIGMVWEKADPWEYRYGLAENYYETHGDLKISQQYVTGEGIWLGKWIYMQRMQYREHALEEEKKAKLDAIGMCWESPAELAFNKGCQALKLYFDEHGDVKVAKSYVTPDGYRLGNWVYKQRKKQKMDRLTQEQRDRLEALGMVWT